LEEKEHSGVEVCIASTGQRYDLCTGSRVQGRPQRL
jgi:hypothetical protein